MPVFYKLDSTRVTLREYSFGTPWLLFWVLLPLAALIKLLRIRIPGSTDDPAVDSIAPFEVEESRLPGDVLEPFEPLTQELVELGFDRPIYHAIHHPIHFTRIYWATFLHPTGQAIARIHHRIWSHPHASKTYLFPVFISEMDDGGFLISSAGKPDMIAPKIVQARYLQGATASELWEFHTGNVNEMLPRQPVPLKTHERVRDMIERLHTALRDFHVDRGVFQPLSEAEQEKLAVPDATAPSELTALPAETTQLEEEVLASLERMQNKKSSWLSFVLVLGVSLLLFVGAGGLDRSFLWLVIPILLFHELGHYLAMRVFGYRNLKMFFVPFLGAAVIGKHYNVPGWKKAVVALMGPLPGIIIGAGLGVGGFIFHQTKVMEAALLMIILNGFNLLPFLPLDGGWVVHAVLFCRHPLLDVGFRLAAVVGIFGLSILLQDRLYLLGIAMLIGLPMVWRVARVAQRLRERGDVAASPDGASIPSDAVRPILAELTAGRQVRPPVNLLATEVSSVFETLNARPPGVAASLGLLAVHGGSFFAALVFVIVLMVGRHGFPWNRRAPKTVTETTPTGAYASGSTREWRGPAAAAIPPRPLSMVIASYSAEETARAEFAVLPAELPPRSTLRLFGQTLVLTLPDDQTEAITDWSNRLKEQADSVIIAQKFSLVSVRLACTASSEEEAKRLEEELQLYSRSHNPLLLPPWSAEWQALPHEARQRFQKARRSFDRFENIRSEAVKHPEVQALYKKVSVNANTMDPVELEKAKASLQSLRKAEEQRLLASLEAEDDKTVDHAILDLCKRHAKLMKETAKIDDEADEKAPEVKAWVQQMAALDQEMARRMGSLPFKDGKPEPGSDRETGHTGRISRHGRTLTIDRATFRDLSHGLPALAEWLCHRDCRGLEYAISVRTFPFGEDDKKGR
jgi:Zn-dependent protease